MRRILLLLGLLAATFLASQPPVVTAATVDVTVSNFAFAPSEVQVQAGDSVRWTWASGTHSVEPDAGGPAWCSIRSSGSCSRAFSADGLFAYHCGVHPSMTGRVRVGAPPPSSVDLVALDLSGTTGTAGSSRLTAHVQNSGTVPATFFALFEYRDGDAWRFVAGPRLTIGAGATLTITETWSSLQHVGRFDVRLQLDPAGTVAETSETNNEAFGSAAFWTDAVEGVDLLDP